MGFIVTGLFSQKGFILSSERTNRLQFVKSTATNRLGDHTVREAHSLSVDIANFNLNPFIGYRNNHCFPKQIFSADPHWAGLPLKNHCVFLKETHNKKLMTFLPGDLVFIFTRGINSIINARKISYSSWEPCTVPQMIPNRKWSRDCKWSPKWTANDPRPQVIPKVDRKWSRKKNRNGLDSS